MDFNLQIFNEQRIKTDLRFMKIIHDLKNHVIVCKQQLDETQEKDIIKVREVINFEIESLDEMLENLRTEYKVRLHLNLKEEKSEVSIKEIIESIKFSQTRLAQNGLIRLKFETSENFPNVLILQQLNTKRIINSLISNILKQTNQGNVEVCFSVLDNSDFNLDDSIQNNTMSTRKIPYNILPSLSNEKYMLIEIQNDGNDMSKLIKPQVFQEKNIYQKDDNWNVTGLGLPVCLKLCEEINAFIRQKIEAGKTRFKLQIPVDLRKISVSLTKSIMLLSDFSKTKNSVDHNCAEVLFAEDNPNILSKYEKIMLKNKIPFVGFLNGKECLNYLESLNCLNCTKSLIFTDMNMPQCDGLKLSNELAKVKSTKNRVYYIVLVSAEEFNNENNNFDKVFAKPITPSNIIKIYNTEIKNYKEIKLSNKNIV